MLAPERECPDYPKAALHPRPLVDHSALPEESCWPGPRIAAAIAKGYKSSEDRRPNSETAYIPLWPTTNDAREATVRRQSAAAAPAETVRVEGAPPGTTTRRRSRGGSAARRLAILVVRLGLSRSTSCSRSRLEAGERPTVTYTFFGLGGAGERSKVGDLARRPDQGEFPPTRSRSRSEDRDDEVQDRAAGVLAGQPAAAVMI